MGKVLIVEDEENTRNGLVKMMETIDNNLEIYTTGAAGEALRIAKENIINAFILDVKIQDYYGIELAKQLREFEKYKLTPIIFTSGILGREIDAYRQTHCYAFIEKPFNERELRQVFETVINYGIKKEKVTQQLQLKYLNTIHFIKENDIIYIERKNRKLHIITTKDNIIHSSSLNSIKERLSNKLMQCHQGFIVNINFIEKIDLSNNYIYLEAIKQPIPIGRKYRKIFDEEI